MKCRILLQTKRFVAEDWLELRDGEKLPGTLYYTVPKVFPVQENQYAKVDTYREKIFQVVRFQLRSRVGEPYYVQVAP